MSEIERNNFIECPYCGAQYEPVEIYIPNAFFGRPTNIDKDNSGKIIDIIGPSLNTDEHYECDYCHRPFRVRARMQFLTKQEDKFNFDDDYTTKLKKKSLFMDED